MEFSRLSVGDPTVAVGLELDVIAAVIIGGGSLSGGRGTVLGTLAGAAIMTVIQVGCSQQGLPNWVQQIVTGRHHRLCGRTRSDPGGGDREGRGSGTLRMLITDLTVLDLRFPTARDKVGTDSVHVDPDYSAAYVILGTDAGLEGHGLTFTIGRGNEVCAAAIDAYRHLVVGQRLGDITADFAGFWHRLAGESQLRWLGPEKGVVHLALAAIVNAVWDLYAKAERKPVWKLLADMTPAAARVVHRLPLYHRRPHARGSAATCSIARRAERPTARPSCCEIGYPAYTTSVGWMGYSDEKIGRLCGDALADGWTHFKVKVGGAPSDDLRRVAAVRDAIGPANKLMVDANQIWDVDTAIERITRALARSISGGRRSRRIPTTCSATRGLRRPWRRWASPPASTAPTACSSSSSCRRRRSASARSTAAGSAA